MRYIKTVIKYSVVVYLCTNVITSFNKIFVRKVNSLTSIYIYIYKYKYKYTYVSYTHVYTHIYVYISIRKISRIFRRNIVYNRLYKSMRYVYL